MEPNNNQNNENNELERLRNRIKELETRNKELTEKLERRTMHLTREISAHVPAPKRKKQVARVRAVNDEVAQMHNPQAILNDFPRIFRITYVIYLWRYKNRPVPPVPRWEYPKVLYIGAAAGEDLASVKRRAIRVIERHWELQNQNGVEVEIPFGRIQNNHADFQMHNRYDEPHLSRWLRIQDQYIRDITNSPHFNQLIALGKGWKHSLLEDLNQKEFKLKEGMCWLDYLEQKLCGRYGFRHFNRIMLENQLYNVTGKKQGFSNDDVVSWIKKYNHPISLFCFDPNFDVRCTYSPPPTRCKNNLKTLCYMLNNRHIYPIENKKLFKSLGCAHIKSLFSFDGLKPKYRINHKSNFKNFIKFENEMSLDDLIYGKIGMNENNCKDVVYFDKNQIKWTDLMSRIINETDYAPSIIRPHNKSFLHPLSNQLYQETEEYDDRKELALMLKNKYKLLNFEWQNQSITQLSNLLFEYHFGYIPKSNHTDLAINLLDNFATMPITCEVDPNVDYSDRNILMAKSV